MDIINIENFNSINGWLPDDSYNDITSVCFENIIERTIVRYLPRNLKKISVLDSPGIVFRPHSSQQQITSFVYHLSDTKDKYLESITQSDFSEFTSLTDVTTNHTPLMTFGCPYITNVGIINAVINEGDLGCILTGLYVEQCVFTSIYSLPLLIKFDVDDCVFHNNTLPIMPQLEILYIDRCNSLLRFSKNLPTYIKNVRYDNMSSEFRHQLERIQLNTLDVIPQHKLTKWTYSTKNHTLTRVHCLVNADYYTLPLFFKKALNAHKKDLTHYELLYRYLCNEVKTENRPITKKRLRSTLTYGKSQSQKSLLYFIMKDKYICQNIISFIRYNKS
jgi:hypothetical protein